MLSFKISMHTGQMLYIYSLDPNIDTVLVKYTLLIMEQWLKELDNVLSEHSSGSDGKEPWSDLLQRSHTSALCSLKTTLCPFHAS